MRQPVAVTVKSLGPISEERNSQQWITKACLIPESNSADSEYARVIVGIGTPREQYVHHHHQKL